MCSSSSPTGKGVRQSRNRKDMGISLLSGVASVFEAMVCLSASGVDRPYVVKGGYDAWQDKGLRTKEGDEYDSSPWQVLAEEYEALTEDTENVFGPLLLRCMSS